MVSVAKPPFQMRFRSELAIITGLAAQSIFVALTYFSLFTFSGPNFDALAYGLAFLGAGAFLTGLIVGNMLKNQKTAITRSFLSALIPTLVFSYLVGQGSWNPIGWVLFVFLFVPLDIFAVAGAVLGGFVKLRFFATILLSVLVLTSLLLFSEYSLASTRHYGDLLLSNDETFTIQGGSYLMHGNISLSGNASLTINACDFYMMHDGSNSGLISLSGNSKMLVKDSTCSITTNRFPLFHVRLILYDNANANMENSSILYTLISYNSSSIALLNCTLTSPASARDMSTLTVSNSTYDYLAISSYESAQTNVNSSNIWLYFGYGNSSVTMADSNAVRLHASDTAHETIVNSSLGTIAAEGFHGVMLFSGANITSKMTVDNASDFYISGDLAFTPNCSVQFNGTLTRNYDVKTTPDTLLNVYNSQNQVLLVQTTSNPTGTANFNLTFTASNYTDTCLLNQKPFTLTSTTPLTYP